MVGVPKALAALLSGETRDTMSLGSFGAYLLEKFFSRRERAELVRTWGGSGASMLPKGGEFIWGNRNAAPDDELETQHHSYGNIISFTKTNEDESTAFEKGKNRTLEKMIDKDYDQNFNVDDSLKLLNQSASTEFYKMLEGNYSFGFTASKKQLKKNNLDPRKWANPLESQLPNGIV
jgi:phospholipid:diacylglycerol acyltransferase